MSCTSHRVAGATLLVVFMLVNLFAWAQGIVTGSVSAVVQDSQGAVISGAEVRAVNIDTKQEFRTTSTAAGVVSLQSLPPAVYELTITAAGFDRYDANRVAVVVGKDTALGTLRLKVGQVSEIVSVEGATPLVESTTSQISESFDSKKVAQLPIGNTFDSLSLFVPGVATVGDSGFSNNNGAEFSVNGERARSNNFQIDGQNNNDNTVGGSSYLFGNQDAIAEVQVITNYSAEYGRNMGSVVNYILKSGTNQFHGTAYELWDGDTFDSLQNQEKNPLLGFCAPGQSPSTGCLVPVVPLFVNNRFGGTIGGPIKKNKVWFFASTNFQRERIGASPQSTAPQLTPDATGIQALEKAFPDSPGVAALAAFGPTTIKIGNPTFTNLQTVPVTVNGVTANVEEGALTRFAPAIFNDYEATGRVDFQLTNKDRLFGRYLFQQTINTNQFVGFPSFAAGGFVDVPARSQDVGLDYTHTFSNTLLDQTRFGYSRSRLAFDGGAYPNCLTSTLTGCFPSIAFAGSDSTDAPFGIAPNFPQGRIINIYELQNNASWVKNRHLLKFGGQYDRQRSPQIGLFNISGAYTFPSFAALVANQPQNTLVANGLFDVPLKENDLAFYFQDDWRIKDNLTLNLGLRWEFYQQAVNFLHDQSVAQQTGSHPFWDPSLPLSQTTVAALPNHYKNFGPVVGFAWTPRILESVFGRDQTVFRGGFRIAYDFAVYNLGSNVAGSAPFVNLVNFPTNSAPGLPTGGNFNTPAIQAFLIPLAPNGGNPGERSQTTFAPNFATPYSQQWNFGMQRQISSRIAAEVRYVGNHTLHNYQAADGNPALGPLVAAGFSNVIPAGLTPCSNPSAPGFASGTGFADCNLTNDVEYTTTGYSFYNGVQSQLRMQSWHGLTVSAAYTFSKTIDNTSEAFSSTQSFGGYGGNTNQYAQNPFDLTRAEKGLSGYDFPHVVGVVFIYDLPFYKNQKGILGHALGGWQVSTTYRYTSGQPYTVVENQQPTSLCDPTNFSGGAFDECRPILSNAALPFTSVGQYCDGTTATCLAANKTSPLSLGTLVNINDPCFASAVSGGTPCAVTPMSAAHWILNNPTAAKILGSPFDGAGRSLYRGQPISTANLAFFKNLKLTERLTFQFQAQAFNVMNVQFRGVPIADINLPGFGSTDFNNNGGGTFAGSITYDGIAQRHLLFGGKLIF